MWDPETRTAESGSWRDGSRSRRESRGETKTGAAVWPLRAFLFDARRRSTGDGSVDDSEGDDDDFRFLQ